MHFWHLFKSLEDKRGIVSSFSKRKKGEKRGREGEACTGSFRSHF